MKSVGVTRRLDDLGRIVIPKSIRNNLGIPEGTYVEINFDGTYITLTNKITKQGIIRQMDELGRVVIPSEIRANEGYESHTAFEIYLDEDTVYLKKYVAGCIFCGEFKGTVNHCGKLVCESCIADLMKLGGY